METPEPVSDVGFRLAVTPAGWPRTAALSSTVPVNPFDGLSVMLLVPVLPAGILMVAGDGVSEKFGPVYTLSLIHI